MKQYRSTCICGHKNVTRFASRDRKWWAEHQHPEVAHVFYNDEGDVQRVVLVTDGADR